MKSFHFVLIAFFCFTAGFCQKPKTTIFSIRNHADSANWLSKYADQCAELGIPNLVLSQDTIHYRFSDGGEIVDVWSLDNKIFHGRILNYIHPYAQGDDRTQSQKRPKLFSVATLIDTTVSRQVFQLFKSVDSIPLQDSIKGWHWGCCDGVVWEIEKSEPTSFYARSYLWASSYTDSVPDAARIQKFDVQLTALLHLDDISRNFENKLPPGAYINPGGFGILVIPTARQRKKMHRYEKRHPQKDAQK